MRFHNEFSVLAAEFVLIKLFILAFLYGARLVSKQTRMHSSRMRTVCYSGRPMGGGGSVRGCLLGVGVSAWGCLPRGVCPGGLPGGVCLGGLPGGGVCVRLGVSARHPSPLRTE